MLVGKVVWLMMQGEHVRAGTPRTTGRGARTVAGREAGARACWREGRNGRPGRPAPLWSDWGQGFGGVEAGGDLGAVVG